MENLHIEYLFNSNAITLTVIEDGKGSTHVIDRDNGVYGELVDSVLAKDFVRVKELIDVAKRIEEESQGHFQVVDGVVHIEGDPAPRVLSQRILDFSNEGLPYAPLVNFWKNLKSNPSSRARERLFLFLENNGHPITEDGHFIAYKRITSDFKDLKTKTIDNTIGSVVEMDRADVDDDPEHTCSTGLHVASRDYAANFYGSGRLVYCKVNPRDVVSIPIDYNNQKMRVCRYEVVAEDEGLRTESVFTGLDHDMNDFGNHDHVDLMTEAYDLGFETGKRNVMNGRSRNYYTDHISHRGDRFVQEYILGYNEGYDLYEDEEEDLYDDAFGDLNADDYDM